MRRSCLAVVSVALAVTSLLIAACGTADSTTTSSATVGATRQSTVSSTSSPTPLDLEDLQEQPAAAQTVPALDGWSITLIPGTDKMLTQLEQSYDTSSATVTRIGPGPPMFDPSVAVDGDRVVYSALYDEAPQAYLYDGLTPLRSGRTRWAR